jgi:hypothetical protein
MATAKVDSIDSLRALKIALVKFAEGATVALGDAEAEMQRMLMWLEMEQHTHWQGQIRKRTEEVGRAAERLRYKKLYKHSTGSRQSAVEEEKALALAKRRLEEAEMKLSNVRRYIPRLQKEIQTYKGSAQRFATTVQVDIPLAISQLGTMVQALENYVALDSNAPELAAQPPDLSGGVVTSEAPAAPPQSEPDHKP